MSKHTPGPWAVQKEVIALYNSAGGWANDAQRINGRTPYGYCVAQVVGSMDAERQANAYLIAAAPELLSTLKLFDADSAEFLKMREDCLAEYGEDVAAGRMTDEEAHKHAKQDLTEKRWPLIRAAIAKAEGRA